MGLLQPHRTTDDDSIYDLILNAVYMGQGDGAAACLSQQPRAPSAAGAGGVRVWPICRMHAGTSGLRPHTQVA